MISVVVVNFNSGAFLEGCIRAIDSQKCVTEIIVVDNASDDGSLERAEAAFPEALTVIRNSVNLGPAVARNQGAAVVSGSIILFVDPDVALPATSVDRLARALAACPGVAAPALFNHAHGRIEYGSTVDLVGYPVCIPRDRAALCVSASALATTREFFELLGGFDDRFFFGAEESDYCWRVVLAGGEIQVLSDLVAEHACGVSTPGGYVRREQIETTAFRLVNRERNTLAMLLKCSAGPWTWILLPSHLAYVIGVAATLALTGKKDIAQALMGGVAWNVRQLPETLRRRRRLPKTHASVARVASRLERGIVPLHMMIRYGLPTFVDRGRADRSQPAAGRTSTQIATDGR